MVANLHCLQPFFTVCAEALTGSRSPQGAVLWIMCLQDEGIFPQSWETGGGDEEWSLRLQTSSWEGNFWLDCLIGKGHAYTAEMVKGWRWVIQLVVLRWQLSDSKGREYFFKDWQLGGDWLMVSVSGCDWMETGMTSWSLEIEGSEPVT